MQQIKNDIRGRARCFKAFPNSLCNRILCNRWNIWPWYTSFNFHVCTKTVAPINKFPFGTPFPGFVL